MQPHLKKCFEGIAKLDFTDSLEILGMISSEKEIVPFKQKVYPAQAKVISLSCFGVFITEQNRDREHTGKAFRLQFQSAWVWSTWVSTT